MSSFDDFITFSEAAKIYNLNINTFKKAIYYNRLIVGKDCMKYGKTWVARKSSLDRLFHDKSLKKKSNAKAV